MTKQLFSTVDLARLIGVAEHRIVYAHRIGRLREPANSVAGRRVYTLADVRRVAEYFQIKPKENQ